MRVHRQVNSLAWVAVAILAVLVMGEDDVTSLDGASEDPEYMLTFEGNHGDRHSHLQRV